MMHHASGEKPVVLKAYVPETLRLQVEAMARSGDRPLSAEVRKALRAHVARHELEQGAA